jgi:type IV secretion system protein VirB6
MDDAAPITWLIGQIDSIVSSGASAAASAVANVVTPIASICFGIYIMLICINYLRGAESEPVFDFGMRMASFAVIIGLGLNAANYSSTVIPIVTGLGSDIANAISGGNVTANSLDQLALHYFDILDQGYDAANAPVFPFNLGPLILYMIKAACILIGLVPFLVAATIAVIIGDVGSIMVAMVGPIYFAFLLFPATRQYFSAWVNTCLSYALIPVFVAVVAVISVSLSKSMMSTGSGTLDDVSLKAVFLASMGNLILLFLLKQVNSLASSLSAGGINAGGGGGIGAAAAVIGSGFSRANMRQMAALGRGGMATFRAGRSLANRVQTRLANRNNSMRRAG